MYDRSDALRSKARKLTRRANEARGAGRTADAARLQRQAENLQHLADRSSRYADNLAVDDVGPLPVALLKDRAGFRDADMPQQGGSWESRVWA